jgi:hypothetical protein
MAPQIDVDARAQAVLMVGVHGGLLHRVTPDGPMAATSLGRKT